MKNICLRLCLGLILIMPLQAIAAETADTESTELEPTLQAGIQWDEEKARETALRHLERQIDVQLFKAKDEKYFDRMRLKLEDPNLKFANQQTTWFQNGEYSVVTEGEKQVNYYRQDGTLFKVSVCNQAFGDDGNYPRRCIEYAYPEGKFLSVSMDVSSDESYVFDTAGTLLQHWKDDQGFSANEDTNWTRWTDRESNQQSSGQ